MAVNEPIWSYGNSVLYNSSGLIVDSDKAWSYGGNILFHEYSEIKGVSICWGHDSGVEEGSIRNLSIWSGTGSIVGSGDDEKLALESDEYMESENIETGQNNILLSINKYDVGSSNPTLQYKNASGEAGLASVSYVNYLGEFDGSGWVKLKLLV